MLWLQAGAPYAAAAMADDLTAATSDEAEAIRNEVPVERILTGTHRILRFNVGRNHGQGWRLDKYLAALLPTISRSLVLRWVERGCASVDGAPVHERVKLRPGQRIVLEAPLPERDADAPAENALAVLYEDRWLMVCNKPPGQLAHQAGRTMTGTLLNQAQDHQEARGQDPRAVRLVNRIDRDTSGIVLLSLDEAAHVRLSQAMEARDLHKEYRAICHGVPAPRDGDWLDPMGEGDGASIARVVRADGQECHTGYHVLETAPAGADPGAYALLRLVLHTGRQHQIRVHASHHGHALVGDWVYGQACAELPGQALHAAVLEFPHPVEHRTVRIEAPLTAAVAALWASLRAGGTPTAQALSAEQRSKLALSDGPSLRRPSWLSEAEFLQLRAEAGE
ncbi:MAG: RluA family pseudouridine synthase [Planctomycetes bacterium]|nr:RluA family pseudouridine synthase [Planctomycetota bacterium]